MALWGVLLLVALIVLPPYISLNRFRRSILQSVSVGLDRPVHAAAIDLSLFPRPAFVLHDLSVSEDPAYGAEPVLLAGEVTATLRASALWHRRVEIASLSFNAPSLNLARNAQGHWDFESLLRNSPALHNRSRPGSMSRPPFPYIEATDARINFKFGPEKLPFSLEGADLALWNQSGNEWHVRIRAHPVRTDLTAANGGEIRGEGVLKVGGRLVDSPLTARLEWRQVELGEIGRLLHGNDNGWRGLVDWTGEAHGTLARLSLTSELAIGSFHRAEFVPANDMDIAAKCRGRYVVGKRAQDTLECVAPVGAGQLSLRGGFADAQSAGALHIDLRHAPAEFFLDLLRHIHPGIADDASASGELNGEANCAWRGLDTVQRCSGRLRAAAIAIAVPGMERPLRFSPILLESSAAHPALPRIRMRSAAREPTAKPSAIAGNWTLAPTRVSLGGAAPATVTGAFNSSGPALSIRGEASLAEISRFASAFKIPAFFGEVRPIRGTAQLALALASEWLPQTNPATGGAPQEQFLQFAPSQWSGTLQLHAAAFHVAGLPAAVELTSGQVSFTPGSVEWTHLKGTFADTPFNGSLRWQTPCPSRKLDCSRSFAFHTSDLNASKIEAVLRRQSGPSGLLSAIDPWATSGPEMPEIAGTLQADVLSAGRISVKDATLRLRIAGHGAQLLAISGDVFGGTLSGSTRMSGNVSRSGESAPDAVFGTAKWGDGPPAYTLRIDLRHLQPNKIAAIWNEQWGLGFANARVDLNTQGWSAPELAQHAAGKFELAWSNGTLAAPIGFFAPAGAESTKFRRWDATGTIRNQTLVLNRSEIVFQSERQSRQALPPTQSVTGKVTFGRELALHLHPSDISIAGPLNLPVATSSNGAQAPGTQSVPISDRSPSPPGSF